jgi:hypothetical protein
MWATLRASAHNNLDGVALISAPTYGQTTALIVGATKLRSAITPDFTITFRTGLLRFTKARARNTD